MASISRFILVFVALVTYAEGNDYPWLNKADVKITNRTDTSVVLELGLSKDVMEKDPEKIKMSVSYERLGFNTQIISAKYHDKECSLRLSYCRLSGLVPGQAYSARIWINDPNGKRLGYADFAFHTMDAPIKEDMVWWMLYVAVPAAALLTIIVLVIVFCIARCCKCWKKKKKSVKINPNPVDDKEQKKENGTTQSGSNTIDRKHSMQTRQWVKDTFATIELDPESLYDHPQASVQDHESAQPIPLDRKSSNKNYYMEVIDDAPDTTTASASRDPSKSVPTTPDIKPKGKNFKKSKPNLRLLTSAADLPPPANDQEARMPPKPCKMKAPQDMPFKTVTLPLSKTQMQAHSLFKQETPTVLQLSELQQKLQGKLQQQQDYLEVPPSPETNHYANTNHDLNRLKGNARKMFPEL